MMQMKINYHVSCNRHIRKSNSLCVVVVVVAAAAVVWPKKKNQPVEEPWSLDEENYFRVLQHPKT
jgi:hypothetical protein